MDRVRPARAKLRQSRPDSGTNKTVKARFTNKTVKARFWPWPGPFSVRTSFNPVTFFPPRPAADLWVVRVGGDDGELRPWHYIYEGRRGRWGTSVSVNESKGNLTQLKAQGPSRTCNESKEEEKEKECKENPRDLSERLHPTPHTPHPTPYTLHPIPYTLHPT